MLPPTGAHVCIRFTRLEDYLKAGSVRVGALASVAPDVDAYSPEADAAWGAFKEQLKSYIASRNTFVVFNGLLCAVIGGREVELPIIKGTWRKASAKDKRHITKWGLKAAIGLRLRRGAMAVKYLSVAEHRAANNYVAAIERAKVRLNERVLARVNTLYNDANRFAICERPGCVETHQLGMMVKYYTLASTDRGERPIAHIRCQDHAPETVSCRACGNAYALGDVTPLSRLVADRRRREGHATWTPPVIDATNTYMVARPDDDSASQAAAAVITYRSSSNGAQTALCAHCINSALDRDEPFDISRFYLHPDGVYGVSPPAPPPDRDLLDYSTNVLETAGTRLNGKRAFACLDNTGKLLVRQDLASAHGSQLYGVELEVESSLPTRIILDAFPRAIDNGQLLIAKRDGSLDRKRGKELVTVPMTIEAQKLFWQGLEHPSIKGKLASYRNTNGRCGCHIHIGLATLTGTQAAVIAYLVAHKGNASLTDLIARRRYSNYAEQIALAKGVTSERLAYAVSTLGHYGAASYSRHGTLEIRVYKGTSLYNGLLIYLEHAESLVAYVKDCVPMAQVDLPADSEVGEAKHYLGWLKVQAGFERLQRHLSNAEDAPPPWVPDSNLGGSVQSLARQEEDEAEVDAEAEAPL